jgi:hypothetical protein
MSKPKASKLTVLFSFLVFGALTICAETALEAPRLLSPINGMELTDVATFFKWQPVAGCSNFVIQIARDSAFNDLVKEKRTLNKGYHKNLYFPKDVLAPGDYRWRVRAVQGSVEGPWSDTWAVRVNDAHPVLSQTVRTIGPATPLFLMRSRAWDPLRYPDNVKGIIPSGLEQVIIVDDLAMATERVVERAKKYQELGVDFVIWDNRCQTSLSAIEYVFQNFSRCIGIAEGEHFSGMYWEKGPEGNLAECDFVHRAWTLCAKYGRFYFFADGDGGSYRWPSFAEREKEVLQRYRKNIVPMFKTTNGDMALHSYGAVQGLMASGYVENSGIWVDEWIWPCCGFGKLGEIIPQEKVWETRRKLGTRQCPWVYDIQMWLMGIVSGSTVFQLESAHQWTHEGKAAANYTRFFLPFVKAVVEHNLIPSREAFLKNIPVAVVSDVTLAKGKHEKQYTGGFAYLKALYALKAAGDQEFIPNDSRYGIVCLLPPDAACLNVRTRVIPQAQLADTEEAKAVFNRSYPARFRGDAFMWACDGTVIVTDSNENQDVDQQFFMHLGPGLVQVLSGTIGVHQYLIGKKAKDGQRFWLQTNSEKPDRDVVLNIVCPRKPDWQIEPAAAAKEARWDDGTKTLTLSLSHLQGAVEVTVQ